ncbi:MAG: M20/M25/M40 family metallo-hydrolase [Planctomycetes bacterium]|nr:M20/M25/M40 family metallo-hydrolase [Planctomycetota bacterium]MCW8135428.1 M20/M25/M40 family metallo-hydrolase [Planctomycetota bacterium]
MKAWYMRALGALALAPVFFTYAVANDSPRPLAPNIDSITLHDLKGDVYFLAGDEMRGRETCQPEALITAAYVRTRMERAGVKPAGENGTWYQTVKLAHREWEEKPSISYTRAGSTVKLAYEQDFVATEGASVNAQLKDAEVAFAGYAVNDTQRAYNDIEGIDLRGKVALIMRYEPTPWRVGGRRNPFSRSANLNTKEALLREAGAAAILMVTGPESLGATDNRMSLPSPKAAEMSPPLYLAGTGRSSSALPFFHVSLEAADALLGGDGKLLEAQKAFDQGEFKARPDLSKLRVSIDARSREVVRECRNVAGKVEGELDEWIIFGAHHDHLGNGYFGSRSPDKMGEIHNGADDNASGVATVLEIAEALAQSGVKPRRGFLFLTFTGEEKGLLGSRWYCENPLVPHHKAIAMINIDMIGRIPNKRLQLQGTASSSLLDKVCREAAPLFPDIEFTFSDRPPMAASDHWPFYSAAGMPVVFPFGGTNAEMHTTLDDPETINYRDMVPAVKCLYEIAWRLSLEPAIPDYIGPVKGATGPDGKPRNPAEKPAAKPEAEREEEFSRGAPPANG